MKGAPASRDEINAALAAKTPTGYALRKQAKAWLKSDKGGKKKKWLKG